MKKILKVVLLLLVLVVVGVIAVASFKLGDVIKKAVETFGPKTLGVDVTLEHASVRPFAGKARLSGLHIGNPEGFNTPSLFDLSDVQVDLDLKSLKTDRILINRILIDAPEITYEKSLTSSNIKKLLEKVSPDDAPEEKNPPRDPKEDPASAKQVVIKDLVIRDATVKFSLKMAGKMSSPPAPLTLGEIHLKDLGGEAGGGQIAAQVLKALLGGIGKAIASSGDLLGDAADLLAKDVLGKGLKEAGKVIEGASKLVGEAGGEVLGAAEGAVEGLKKTAGSAGKLVEKPLGEAGKALGAGAEKLVGGLGGLLKKSPGNDDPAEETPAQTNKP